MPASDLFGAAKVERLDCKMLFERTRRKKKRVVTVVLSFIAAASATFHGSDFPLVGQVGHRTSQPFEQSISHLFPIRDRGVLHAGVTPEML